MMLKEILYILLLFLSSQRIITNNTDDTKNLQILLNGKNQVEFPADNIYKIKGTLYLKNNQTLIGNGATIIQMSPGKPIFNCAEKENISITGLTFKGYGNDYEPTASSLAVGIYCFGTKNLRVKHNNFFNFSYSPISGLRNVKNVLFENNYCEGSGLNKPENYQKDMAGIAIGGDEIKIINNRITNSSQGIIIAEGSNKVTIKNNHIFNLPLEHGIYIDTSCSNITIEDNRINNIKGSGIKIQNRSKIIASGISKNIFIKNNVVLDAELGDGILIINTEGNEVYAENVIIQKNIVKNVGQDGISIRVSKNSKVLENQIQNTKRAGIYLQNNHDLMVYKNRIEDTQQNGIFDEGSGKNISIDSNTIINIGIAGNDKNGLSSGIFIQNAENRSITNNYVKGNSNHTQYALYIPYGNQNTMILKNNKFIGARDFGARFSEQKTKFKEFTGNQFDSKISGSKNLNQP